ncbi:amidohydrolase family protein [Sphingomonas sp.]|uniref:metal-dependent hydrolase family protein n=1 Tax=Sphingomonas sp. TaxID=28214 RepID=UPI0017B5F584|nr:amidohydrolase family protein [Sphingomonas sp.]MBA3510334.1 amidohydrolase family protein [Sphingomonas sp.]
MSIKSILAALLAASAASSALAAPTFIHAGRLIAVPGKAVRGPSTIVVDNGRIVSVTNGLSRIEPGASYIDLRGRTVLPGLIDSHVHLESDAGGDARLVESVTLNDAERAFKAMANGRKTLEAGFTTVRNLGGGPAIGALRNAVAAGTVRGPRILDAASGISTTSGHGDSRVGLVEELHPAVAPDNVCDGAEECRRAVRAQVRRGADVIKTMTTGGVNSRIGAGLTAQMFDDEIKAIVDTARLYGKKVAVHAHGADGINMALAAGAHSIEHGTLLDEEGIRLFKRTNAYYVPTLSTVNGYLERIAADPNAYPPAVRAKIDWRIGITGQALRKAVPAGVRIAFGTDAGVSKHGRNADEFELMVKHGMSPAAAIQAATVNAADLLGLASEIGTIEPGKSADIIAVAGDPLSDVTVLKRVDFVMARGEVVKAPPAR